LKNKPEDLIGGNGARLIPKFNGDMNDPFTTEMEKGSRQIHKKDKTMMQEKFERINPPAPPPQPMMQMTVMDSVLGDGKPAPKPPAYIYPAQQVPMPNSNNPIATDYMIPWNHNQENVPLIKKYNISIQGMDGNLTMASKIFEDILPESKVGLNRMTTLNERNVLHSYIRSILLKRGDGEEVTFDDKKPELINLLSYMKMMEINPYHFSRLTDNAYKTMSDNFIMFRSCYPIRLDKRSNNLACASDNIGANIRVYALSVYDELAGLLNEGGIRKVFSDPWREIMFYSYVREEILKKKICPHFPFLHTYYIAENSSIDFDKLKSIKGSTNIRSDEFIQTNKKIKQNIFKKSMDDIITTKDGYNYTVDMKTFTNTKHSEVVKMSDTNKKNSRLSNSNKISFDNKEIDINDPSTKCIVAVTEAPDQNIIDWSTRTYIIEEGPIRKQISSGVHSDLTWKSILFQLLISFAVMYSKKIAIRDFSWEKNVFIKTFSDSGAVGYWKYTIKDVDFYVPNMKALLMIDSCYDQITGGFAGEFNDTFKFKLMGKFFDTPNNVNFATSVSPIVLHNDNMDDVFRDMFKTMFDVNTLVGAFTTYGGVRPSDDILKIISDIHSVNFLNHKNDGTTIHNDLTDIFINQFGMFLHNKLGDMVDQTDMQQLHNPGVDMQQCKKGELVAYNAGVRNIAYKWAIVLSSNPLQLLVKEVIGDKDIYRVDNTISANQTRRIFGNITQKYKPDHKINSSDELLETYNVTI
jgi:hypothetical protein